MKAKIWSLDTLSAGSVSLCYTHIMWPLGSQQVLPYFLVYLLSYFSFSCICQLFVAVTDTQEKGIKKRKGLFWLTV